MYNENVLFHIHFHSILNMSIWSTFLVVPYLSLTRRKVILTQISCFSRFFQISENISITFTDEFSYQLTSKGKKSVLCIKFVLLCYLPHLVQNLTESHQLETCELLSVMVFLLLNGNIWISNSKHRYLLYYQAVLPHQAFLILVIFFSVNIWSVYGEKWWQTCLQKHFPPKWTRRFCQASVFSLSM